MSFSGKTTGNKTANSRTFPKATIETGAVDRTAHLIKDASKAMVRALQTRLAEHAVAHGHWTFLRVLWKSNGISQTELSERAGVAKPSTAAAVKAMEDLGYIERRQKTDNKKKVYIHLTEAGRALEAVLVPEALDVNEVALEGLSEQQVIALRQTLSKIIDNLALDGEKRTHHAAD
ncbi:MarR family transcriptional regulator [Roseiarcaceae bacterium H3SJ34-1]|uniref:MarR family winged helix-turn-helix transcriptional regulator n=1 Tax=Terripilifer ovatus TaxID=3032367 RepID=UPI003AB957C3|nr:MarR family transcriptional regulator [Roseiarcaceae bacterium H3SJ34-1]